MFWDGSCRARPFTCAGRFEHAILERRRRFAFVTLQAELAPLGFDSRPGPPPFRIPSGKGRSCTFAHVAPIASHCIPESCDPVAILLAVCSCEVFEPIEVRFEVGLYTQAHLDWFKDFARSEEHTSELQSPDHLVCRLLLEKKKKPK